MYAIIKTGGKQYKVAPGDVLEVEHLKGDSASFVPILVVTDDGKTLSSSDDLKSYNVDAKVLGETKGEKVTVFKYRNKSGYASKTGHRQRYSQIEITGIGGGAKSSKSSPAKPEEEPAETPAAEASG